jgi:ribosomal protein S18 acetylase RimI-like enzyme
MNFSIFSARDPRDPMKDIRLPQERVHVREFRYPEDYQAARFLWENAGSGINVRRSDEPEEIQKKLQRDPDLFLVAEDDGKLIGTVIGGFDGRRGLIYHLAVDAAFRQHGIGSLLMDEVERRLKAKGCLKCYLMVTVDNDNAMRFYEARNWERMDTVYTYTKSL